MDYVKFVAAIKNGNSKEFGPLYKEAFEILCTYLRVNMGASLPDAKDCAQHALINTMDRIRDNAIREPGSIYYYLIQSAKNKYLRLRYEQQRSNFQENIEPYLPVENPVDLLVSDEEQQALDLCIDKLPDKSKSFINYYREHPGVRASEVAYKFGISVNNVWTKKHRIQNKLYECVKKKLGD